MATKQVSIDIKAISGEIVNTALYQDTVVNSDSDGEIDLAGLKIYLGSKCGILCDDYELLQAILMLCPKYVSCKIIAEQPTKSHICFKADNTFIEK